MVTFISGQVFAKIEDARGELAAMKRKEEEEQRKMERMAEETARKVCTTLSPLPDRRNTE